ncbi:MAG: hypothetical protein WAX16_04775 [Lactococcus raffinolactis]
MSGRKTVIGTFGSEDPKVEKETNVKLAELAKTSQNGSFKGNRFKKVVSASVDDNTTMGVAKSNQGKRNDLTSGSDGA